MSGSSGSNGDPTDRKKRKKSDTQQARIATKLGSITALTSSAKKILNKGSGASLLKKEMTKLTLSQKSAVKVT